MFKKKDTHQADLEVFTIYDKLTESYREPSFVPNSAVLIREFTNVFSDPKRNATNPYYQNAEDYTIFRIGSFDFKTGVIQYHDPVRVAYIHEIKAMVLKNQQQIQAPGIVPT